MAQRRRRRRPTRASEHRKLLNEHRHHYDALLEFQGGGCAICGRPPSENRRLDLDHDHKAMIVRGLLCVRCNRTVPDWVTSDWLRRAAAYLERTPYSEFLKSIGDSK